MQMGIRHRVFKDTCDLFFLQLSGRCVYVCDVIIYPISYPWKFNNKTKEEIELVDGSYSDGPGGGRKDAAASWLVTHSFMHQIDLILFFIVSVIL